MKSRHLFLLTLTLPAISPVAAQDHRHTTTPAPYEGYQTREIKGLSDQDILEIRRGGGWGLALPAELNGKPGPVHLLELQDQLGLSEAQVTAIEALQKAMRAEAIRVGARLIATEAALSAALATKTVTKAQLIDLVQAAAAARGQLRFVHLSRHLSTPSLLNDAQMEKYNRLRGYTDDL